MKKKVILFFLLICVVSFGVYSYLYKAHRNISDEKASYTFKTNQLIEEYSRDENSANSKYLDKVIVVSGKITQVNIAEKSITLDEKLSGLVIDDLSNLKVDDSITIKGRFLGYDELLEEVKMDQINLN
ncbi:hypothetical protein [uncultured Flavobacterium sp.]|uniref:OB-fold protein n=1 Tax=uncultured Flavobacterium sp. TaxID=165435 RepID=UPI0030C7A6A2